LNYTRARAVVYRGVMDRVTAEDVDE